MSVETGTVIHGTLNPHHLLPAFRDELDRVVEGEPTRAERELLKLACTVHPDSEGAATLINDLLDALSERAPEGMYFGTIEGDGSDFGWWPTHED